MKRTNLHPVNKSNETTKRLCAEIRVWLGDKARPVCLRELRASKDATDFENRLRRVLRDASLAFGKPEQVSDERGEELAKYFDGVK